MTRNEHLQWAKDRALVYVNMGDLHQAFGSLTSDLGKHDGLRDALEIQMHLGAPQMLAGMLNTSAKMRDWIEGFA